MERGLNDYGSLMPVPTFADWMALARFAIHGIHYQQFAQQNWTSFRRPGDNHRALYVCHDGQLHVTRALLAVSTMTAFPSLVASEAHYRTYCVGNRLHLTMKPWATSAVPQAAIDFIGDVLNGRNGFV